MKNRIFQFKFMLFNLSVVLLAEFFNTAVYCQIPIGSPGKTQALLNEVVDISGDFRNFSNTYYLADSADGKLITKTINNIDGSETFTPLLPFSFVRRASDYSTSMDAVFSLSPDEKIFGCGESFTEFDKRGQKAVLWTDDANGTQNETMYKPVPFFLSSRGYGLFMHTSSPVTCDFGKYYSGIYSLMIGDDEADIFIFLGKPKDILNEYTNITGKAPMPPLWSFGFWMSRITYYSEAEGCEVTKKLRENKIPSDVYLPPGQWIDYQTAKVYSGGWHNIEAGKIPIVVLVHEGAVIPHIALAQSTAQMDWSKLDLIVYATDSKKVKGLICLPSDNLLHKISLVKKGDQFIMEIDPLAGKVSWKMTLFQINAVI